MSRLTRPARRGIRLFGRRRDAGGVAVIVGILTATGVLLGMAALAVDVGQLYAEREDLQSGADGVATAVALDCAAQRVAECTSNPTATKLQYGNGNAKDGLNDVQEICGNSKVGGTSLLPGCVGGYPDNLTHCIGSLPANTKGWVEVHTRTLRDDADRYILPPTFAQTLAGGYDGTTVQACSRVAWGTPLTGVALTFCKDEFDSITSNGTNLAPAPPAVPSPALAYEQKFNLLTPGGGGPGGGAGGPCDDGPSGWDVPGDFGWLDTLTADGCEALIDAVYDPDPGVSAPRGCRDVFEYIVPNHIPVAIPIYDGASGGGAGGSYTLKGIAAVVFTGYNIANVGTQSSWLTGRSCRGSDKCLYGYFTQGVTPLSAWSGHFSSTDSYGASIVKTVG